MWSFWLVFCDCGFHSVCPLTDKDNRLMEASCWVTLTVGSACALISHASKIMHNILQARLQQYMNCKLPDVQAGFRKGRGNRDQIANICWIIKKSRKYQKNICFCFIDYVKAFDCVITTNVENSERDGNIRTPLPTSWETCKQVKKQQ